MKKILICAAAFLALAAAPARAQLAGKKVLFVNSYHEGYEWSDGEEKGAKSVLEAAGAQVTFFRMDTKRHQDEAFRKAAGQKAKAQIEALKPDAVILSDDPAVQYLLVPFYKDASLPFVFCGVNWEATKYGLPYKNATGMVEVALVKELLGAMKDYAKGPRVAFLTVDSETERIELPYYKKALGLSFSHEKLVKTFAEWKDAYTKLQGETDAILLGNFAGINDWNEKEAAEFAAAHAKVISGAMYDFMMPYAMLGFVKVAEEQGQWAAKTTIAILKGTAPSAIPVTPNKQAKVLLNPAVAGKAGILFKPELVRSAQVAK
ncbi:MAG TPA: ABC transporter substrate binding protein [Anaeromyxobacter sp.]|nr:ABC transporter substrate binding protein [Anaeromyxobacter sp.]